MNKFSSCSLWLGLDYPSIWIPGRGGIEFIYKEPGVNRSLTPDDDEKKNLTSTRYRNQINKVALSIKEIILGLKTDQSRDDTEKIQITEKGREELFNYKDQSEAHKSPFKLTRKKLLSGLLTVILAVATVLFYPRIINRNKLEKLKSPEVRIYVAVMPFHNLTNDTIMNVWQDGIQDILIDFLSNSEEVKVKQIESISNLIQSKGLGDYASITPFVAGKISQKHAIPLIQKMDFGHLSTDYSTFIGKIIIGIPNLKNLF